jgi:hypothetical protein
MSTSMPLSLSASVALDASGDGSVSLGPVSVGEVWYPSTVACSVATNISEALGYLYIGVTMSAGVLVGSTVTASTGDSDNLDGMPVYVGSFIWFQWLGGDVAELATLSVFGTRQVPGPSNAVQ